MLPQERLRLLHAVRLGLHLDRLDEGADLGEKKGPEALLDDLLSNATKHLGSPYHRL